MSAFTPVAIRSTNPTDLPFLPFEFFSSGMLCAPTTLARTIPDR
jgi:hypothetical protein